MAAMNNFQGQVPPATKSATFDVDLSTGKVAFPLDLASKGITWIASISIMNRVGGSLAKVFTMKFNSTNDPTTDLNYFNSLPYGTFITDTVIIDSDIANGTVQFHVLGR